MVLVIIIVVAWIIILGPNLLKRHARAGDGISSISHFHHQLRVLEHSAPQPIVAPAYRLCSGEDSTGRADRHDAGEVRPIPVLTVVGATQLPRPALAFLGADHGDSSSGQLGGERTPSPDQGATGSSPGSATGTIARHTPAGDFHGRHLARRRRRDTLSILSTVFVLSGLFGFVPGAGVLWMVTALSGVTLVAYVALLVHLRRAAEEREGNLHYLRPDDDGRPEREGRFGTSTRMSGRYAHPSHQAALAR